ncbi:hypothetical protein KIN20_017106 [Parelaphostrongylus tenuis]|uniref:Uncharacterized protein n=1 Tax=Parelaphostrongylus tenuis TaxID=148309 RepID=A0AAD5QR89_PARTN|nr:hypothetical protein KIN20_017106 [Parelaphostrongylus tenuis]
MSDSSSPQSKNADKLISQNMDACNVDTRSDAIGSQQTSQSNEVDSCNESEGFFLYVPGQITAQHIQEMQKFIFDFLGGATGPLETIPRPLFTHVNMSPMDIQRCLETDEGQKSLRKFYEKNLAPASSVFGQKLENTAFSYSPSHKNEDVS